MTCGYVATRKGMLQMTCASRVSPKVHVALQPRVSMSYTRLLTLTVAHWSSMTATCIQDYTIMKLKAPL
eukprot:5125104-Pyramimonas_sp.AAC.1